MKQYYKRHSSYNSAYSNWKIYGLYSDGIGYFRDFYAVSNDGRKVYGDTPGQVQSAIIDSDYYKARK